LERYSNSNWGGSKLRKHIVTVRDTAGNVQSGVSVYVYTAGGVVEATLYSDNGVTKKGNPVTTNSKGQAEFYVADGVYDIYVSGSSITPYTLEDVTIYEPVGVTAIQTLTNKTITTPSITFPSAIKTSAYTATAADFLLHCDATNAAFTLTLPPAALHTGRIFVVGKYDSGSNAVLVDGYGSETINGVSGIYLYLQYDYITVQSDGSSWKLLAKTWQEAIIYFSISGNLTVTTNAAPSWVFTWLTGRIVEVCGYVRTASTGADIIFDINKNGTTIWSTQVDRLTIAATTNMSIQSSFNTTALSQNDRLDLDVDQVGSGTAGADATILLNIRVQSMLLSQLG
jgi:hypothetical protein